jgi:hypothetical protein
MLSLPPFSLFLPHLLSGSLLIVVRRESLHRMDDDRTQYMRRGDSKGGKVWTKAGKTMCIVSNAGTNVTAEGHSRILPTFSRGLSSAQERKSCILKSVRQSGRFLDMPAHNPELRKFSLGNESELGEQKLSSEHWEMAWWIRVSNVHT